MEYIPPVQPVIVTSPIGQRGSEYHRGTDLACNYGQPIVASAEGQVVYAGWAEGGFGNLVTIAHPDGNKTYYAHNSRVTVAKGSYVVAGQKIAECGSTGRSTGNHSHWEIRDKNGNYLHPAAVGLDL